MLRRYAVLTLFLLALVLRLGVVLATADLPIGLDDMFQYDMLARSIVAGNGYRWYGQADLNLILPYIDMEVPPDYDPRGVLTSFRPPLYPAFLAAIYAVVGTGPTRFLAARLVQAVLGAALVPLTAALGRRLGLSRKAVVGGAAIVTVYPLLVVYPLALATEVLYMPLFVLSLWAILRARETGRTQDYVLVGLVLGLTALTRSVVTFFVPLAALWVWATSRPRRTGLRQGAVLILCFLIVTLPWSIRNTILHGEFHFVESALGYDLYQGYHPQSTGTFDWRIGTELLEGMDDAERHHRAMGEVWTFVRADPLRIPYLMFRKLGYFWGLDKRALIYFYANGYLGRWPAPLLAGVLLLTVVPFTLVAPAGLARLALAQPRREMVLLALLFVYYVGIHTLILAEDRFHVPLVPILALLAASMLVKPTLRWQAAQRWQRVLAVTLVALLIVNWGWEIARDRQLLAALFGPEGNELWIGY
jgi:4-amino-4-deoxy-L-arabinose transferase-like glycosyltransferase